MTQSDPLLTHPGNITQPLTPNKSPANFLTVPVKTHWKKQPQWREVDNMAAAMTIVMLSEATINESSQNKCDLHAKFRAESDNYLPVMIAESPELNNWQCMEVWKSHSRRIVGNQESKNLAICRKLRGALQIVEAHNTTGNATDKIKMRCAVGICNGAIKVSYFYEVLRNPNYAIRKLFPYPKRFHWLSTSTSELDTTSLSVSKELSSVSGMAFNRGKACRVLYDVEGEEKSVLVATPFSAPTSHERLRGSKREKISKKLKIEAE
ncbi:hypothetical protein BWQ96_00372 [Gracilariopsis chorda]|uniref:Uncharacterized protein n=1 Tax=Gracilariopsis chorda TaxID=448386 RepID=A0A2V3JAP4_9FLOR|nr:hypothetical protein BWQ96_00372 [Gracilariopsis chorda]|eukprot:PXF49720.1 hypothetical protein BWQ96_00372 [Gracilariopsis chorda]